MKDYRLSEIKEYCKKRHKELFMPCRDCEFWGVVCDEWTTSFETLDIEPRDMIELPCKEKNTWGDVVTYYVIYRDKYGHIQVAHDFFEEVGADKFLQELKNAKSN